MKSLAIGAVLAALPLAAMAADIPQDLSGDWRVQTVSGQPSDETLGLTMRFQDGGVGGFAGCNTYSGGIAQAGETNIVFGPIAATRKMCPDAMMAAEHALLSTMKAVGGWETAQGGDIHLLDAQGATVIELARDAGRSAEIRFDVPGADGVETLATRYDCDGMPVEATYLNAGDIALALLTIDGEFVVATNVIAASGAKYAGRQYVWWTKGDGAMLEDLTEPDSDPIICKQRS